MIHGFINVNKQSGMTSHDVVAKLRKILSTKKVGHTGTLDPMVTGVLPVAIGQATKLSDFLLEGTKTYEGSMVLGISTTTEDLTGEFLEDNKSVNVPTSEQIIDIMHQLTGEIEQTPPMYSAVKVKGKKLYELARQGVEISRPARKITIQSFVLHDISTVIIDNHEYPIIAFKVVCSKGTYVRTLCVQVGKLMNLPACMHSLVRTESAGFKITDSLFLDEIKELVDEKNFNDVIINMDKPLSNMPSIFLSEEWTSKVLNGMPYYEKINDSNLENEEHQMVGQLFRVYDHRGVFFALYKLINIDSDNAQWKAEKVFREVIQIE